MISRVPVVAVIAGIATVIAGCERPGDRTPPGFVEACDGGRAQMAIRKHWSGPVEVEWPEQIPASEKKALPDSVESCVENAG
jgi:hypothetical protein